MRRSSPIAQQMARLTGLSPDYILRSNLRVHPNRFRRELLRDRRQIIGRIDSRYVGTEPDAAGEAPSYDPQASAITGGLRRRAQRLSVPRPRLQDAADLPAEQLCRASATDWNFQHKAPDGQQIAPTPASIWPQAMRENPRMKFLSVNGLYDLATPFFGAEYEFGHMALEPQIAANIRYTYYPAGHMMYTDPPSARQLKADLAGFYASAI